MKKILCALVLSMICLTGCQSNKSKNADITENWKTGELKKDFYKKDFGVPDEEHEQDLWDEIVWRNYPINDSYSGLLTLQYDKDNSNEVGNYYFIDWVWSAISTKDDFLKIYNYCVNLYGKPLNALNNNEYVVFDVREATPNDVHLYEEGSRLGLSIYYKESDNTIKITYPAYISPEDLTSLSEEET